MVTFALQTIFYQGGKKSMCAKQTPAQPKVPRWAGQAIRDPILRPSILTSEAASAFHSEAHFGSFVLAPGRWLGQMLSSRLFVAVVAQIDWLRLTPESLVQSQTSHI